MSCSLAPIWQDLELRSSFVSFLSLSLCVSVCYVCVATCEMGNKSKIYVGYSFSLGWFLWFFLFSFVFLRWFMVIYRASHFIFVVFMLTVIFTFGIGGCEVKLVSPFVCDICELTVLKWQWGLTFEVSTVRR